MNAKLLAKSSAGDPYSVEFSVTGDCVRVFCQCKAGVVRMMCKHKEAFISGDATMLFDSTSEALLREIATWPQFGRLKARMTRYEKELQEIDIAKAELARKEKAIKAQLGVDLTLGGYV